MALERLRAWIEDTLSSARTSKVLTVAVRAYRGGDLATARAAVDEVLCICEPGRSHAQRIHRASVRLMAVTLRAEVAAQQGDAAVARASIAEGFTLWEEAKRAPQIGYRSLEAYASWERWARDWLERDGANGA